MPTNDLELLSPAGSMDALKAAFANGADAAYLGAAAFGARAAAGFDEPALRQAIRLAHLHGKRIYVTVNILVKEREWADVRRTLSLLSSLGADAVLVQDLGVLKICREEYPSLPIHASTQMAVHNASGVRWLQGLAVRRAVMARECDLAALRQAADTGMEIEAFCHGALCVSCSGQCLFSSMIGGRSGNRGRCAQPCRLPYVYQGQNGAWLSPRDLCTRDELRSLADAGVYSFKIEGRLKRPEYVAVVTRAYRRALDDVLEGRFSPADRREREALTQIFSRGGFTTGYPGGAQDAGIIDPGRVTPAGLNLGTVRRVYEKGGALLADVRLTREMHNGDGLEVGDQALRYSGPEAAAGQTASLRLRERVTPGDAVRRTEDESQLAAARATYEESALNAALPIPFAAAFTAYPGHPLSLTVTDGEHAVTVTGDPCAPAQKKPLDADAARSALGKTGGTPFVLGKLTVKTAGAFASAAALNALRREALGQLSNARADSRPSIQAEKGHFTAPARSIPHPRLIVKTAQAGEIPALLRSGAAEVLLQPVDYRPERLLPLLKDWPRGTRLCLPAQCREDTFRSLVGAARESRVPLCLQSPGQLDAGGDQEMMAGEGIPVMNGEAARLLSCAGCASVTLSRELSREEIGDLPDNVCEYILPVYGRARLMLLNHCPMRTALGMAKNRVSCDLCSQGKGARGTCLTDRMQAQYPLMPLRLPEGCQIELMDSRPLHLEEHLKGLPGLSWLLVFSDEPAEERLRITAHYAALLRGENVPPLALRGTPGRFLDGVQ